MSNNSQKQPKNSTVASSVPKILLHRTSFDTNVRFKGLPIPKDQVVDFYANGDIEFIDENGFVSKCVNIGEENTISDMEAIGKEYL